MYFKTGSRRAILAGAICALSALPAVAAPCGGSFNSFIAAMSKEAAAQGLPQQAISAFFAGAKQDPRVLKADRAQGVFQKPFSDFSKSVISKNRLQNGAAKLKAYRSTFDQVERNYGIPRGILAAFWGLETDFGAVQGDFNTRNALVTLAHDCRRPELFQPQVLAGIALTARGDLSPELPSQRSVGYRQALRHLEGQGDFAAFRAAGIAATRQLAKRQLTWLRSWQNLSWLNADLTQQENLQAVLSSLR